MTPRVVMLSWWRNDADRQIEERVSHLLSKTYPDMRYVWVVGDCTDNTEELLRRYTRYPMGCVDVVRHDTGTKAANPDERCVCLSQTLTYGLKAIRDDDDIAVIHESDLLTPTDVVERFLASGKDIIAGWPVLPNEGNNGSVFYDIWAYRQGGQHFTNNPPYHWAYRPDQLFEVDAVGSCWAFPAQAARDLTIERWACVELCQKLQAKGLRLWVDPTIEVIQPRELWASAAQPNG